MKNHNANNHLLSLFFALCLFASNSFAGIKLVTIYDDISLLKKIDKTEAVSFLLTCLNDKNEKIRSSAARELGSLHAKEAIPRLFELLNLSSG